MSNDILREVMRESAEALAAEWRKGVFQRAPTTVPSSWCCVDVALEMLLADTPLGRDARARRLAELVGMPSREAPDSHDILNAALIAVWSQR